MKYVGLWLDHKKAVVIKWAQNKETTQVVRSEISPLLKSRMTSRVAPKKQEDRWDHVVSKFYKDVFKAIKSSDKIFLMGPGLAKKEFKIFLKEKGLLGKVVEMTNADKMTDRQVAAKTRNFFGLNIND